VRRTDKNVASLNTYLLTYCVEWCQHFLRNKIAAGKK
jgi:uncharacterized protein YutD